MRPVARVTTAVASRRAAGVDSELAIQMAAGLPAGAPLLGAVGGALAARRQKQRPPLSRRQKQVHRAHARIRALGERAVATLKTWKILAKRRYCPRRATAIVLAILTLQAVEDARHPG
jgi:DDE superfamily endonuclease